MRRVERLGGIERLAELDAHRNGVDVGRGPGPRWDRVVREREQRDVGARVERHLDGVVRFAQAAAPVAVLIRRRIHDVTARLQVREVELAARVGHGQVSDAVRQRHRLDQRAQQDRLLDPPQRDPADARVPDFGTGREKHRLGGVAPIAAQVRKAGLDVEPVDAPLPSFFRFDVHAAAMPTHFHRPRHRGQQHELPETAHARPASSSHFIDDFIELNHRVAVEIGNGGAGLGLHVDNFGGLLVRRPAWRGADTRAREQQSGYEQPSDLSLPARTSR